MSLNLKPNVSSILESFPCALEKNMYPVVVGYSVLYVLDLVGLLCWLNVLFPYSSFSGCFVHYYEWGIGHQS